MIEIPLKLQGKMNSSGLLKLNLISIIVKGDCLLDVNVQCAQGSYLPKSPGSPNCVEGGGDTPLCCIHLQVVNSPQSASLGDAVETSLPRTRRQMLLTIVCGLFKVNTVPSDILVKTVYKRSEKLCNLVFRLQRCSWLGSSFGARKCLLSSGINGWYMNLLDFFP